MDTSTGRLRARIADDLRRFGIATEAITDLSVPLDEWRRIAIETASILHRPVFTFVYAGYVSALVEGWPATHDERTGLMDQLAHYGLPHRADPPTRSTQRHEDHAARSREVARVNRVRSGNGAPNLRA